MYNIFYSKTKEGLEQKWTEWTGVKTEGGENDRHVCIYQPDVPESKISADVPPKDKLCS